MNAAAADLAKPITENQRQILLQLFAGRLEEEIAVATGRKPSTIFNTLRRVANQLGARSNYDVVRECLRRGIVTLDEIYAIADSLPHDHGDRRGEYGR